MTTTVIVHNAHRTVTVKTLDRVWDPEENKLTDEWREVGKTTVCAGHMHQTYCTDTRRIEIVEE